MYQFIELQPFLKNSWTEAEVNLALRRINAKKVTPKELFDNNTSLYNGEGLNLEEKQQQKALKFLKARTFNKKGDIKDSSELREREADIIKDPSAKVKLVDFYTERGNYYVPLYRVQGDNNSMDYYYANGKVNIVG